MTITAEATGPASEQKAGVGRIARVTGPVVDVEFPHDAIPETRSLSTSVTTSSAPSLSSRPTDSSVARR
jgi:F-type H+-transporting ATPase subunit beta